MVEGLVEANKYPMVGEVYVAREVGGPFRRSLVQMEAVGELRKDAP